MSQESAVGDQGTVPQIRCSQATRAGDRNKIVRLFWKKWRWDFQMLVGQQKRQRARRTGRRGAQT